jgi:hypothetical protein
MARRRWHRPGPGHERIGFVTVSDSIAALSVRQENAQGYRKWASAPGHKAPCYVCGGYAPVCHWHHIPPVAEVAASDLLAVEVMRFEWPLVSLCPTHHAVAHLLRKKSLPDDVMLALGLNEQECRRLQEIEDMEREAWEVLYG